MGLGCVIHNWGWPRKRGDRDMQVCARCGQERESKVQFDGPRLARTRRPEEARLAPAAAVALRGPSVA